MIHYLNEQHLHSSATSFNLTFLVLLFHFSLFSFFFITCYTNLFRFAGIVVSNNHGCHNVKVERLYLLVSQEAIAKKLGILTGSGVALASAFEKMDFFTARVLQLSFWTVVQLDWVMYTYHVHRALEGLTLTQAEIPEAS